MDTNKSAAGMMKCDHWNQRAKEHGASRKGYKAICSYGAPYVYNKYIDIIHKKAFLKMLRRCQVKDKKVIDVGCGVGRWCRLLSGKGARVTGLDISEEMIKVAERALEGLGVNFINVPISDVNLPRGTFDMVTCVTVLQHVTDETDFKAGIANMVNALKKGGKALIMEVAPSALPASSSFNKFMSVRTDKAYISAFNDAGVSLEDIFSVDVMPLKQMVISSSKWVPKSLFYVLISMSAFISLFIDYLFSGTRFFTKYSWHKAFIFIKN